MVVSDTYGERKMTKPTKIMEKEIVFAMTNLVKKLSLNKTEILILDEIIEKKVQISKKKDIECVKLWCCPYCLESIEDLDMMMFQRGKVD